ncbi:MAG: VWA-like domain-containing protein [Candidatus Nomurabacteria bacterium]|jgi:predicted metal-dependent peptidase|nr:VWA-like domain-containing protein [Candidatus Nomurabacteria bacterium]
MSGIRRQKSVRRFWLCRLPNSEESKKTILGGDLLDTAKYSTMPFRYKLSRFSLKLRKIYPFLGELCSRVEKWRSEKTELAATDGLHLYLNEARLAELPEEGLNFVLLHELFHIVLRHRFPKNLPFYAKRYWNIAADLVVNWLILSMQSELKNAGLPVQPIADTALTTDNLAKDNSGIIAKSFIAQAVGQGVLTENPPLLVELKWKAFECVLPNFEAFAFDLLETDGATDGEEAKIEVLFAECEKTAGKDGMPHQLRDLWREMEKDKLLDWYLLLKRWLEGVKESEEQCFSTPDKRLLYSGMILPGYEQDAGTELNRALVVLDVSSSVNREELLKLVWQIADVLAQLEFAGEILSFGSGVYQEAKLSNKASLKSFIDELKVGGGTDWGEVVRHIQREKLGTSVVIVFTDGYFYSFDKGLQNVVFITLDESPSELQNLGKVIQINQN